jgi:hypothetical protein
LTDACPLALAARGPATVVTTASKALFSVFQWNLLARNLPCCGNDVRRCKMSTFRAFVAALVLIGMSQITSACTMPNNHNRADFQYRPGSSGNPACAGGFRPTNALSCY